VLRRPSNPDATHFTLGAPPQACNSVGDITVEDDVVLADETRDADAEPGVERATREHGRIEDRHGPQRRAELIGPAPSNLSLLQNSSNAANFPCVRGAERPALRPARA